MNWDVFITCAVTGSGDSAGKSDKVPVTPKEIAASALDAARAAEAAGAPGPLHGVPMTIKDSLDTADLISTGGTNGRRG